MQSSHTEGPIVVLTMRENLLTVLHFRFGFCFIRFFFLFLFHVCAADAYFAFAQDFA